MTTLATLRAVLDRLDGDLTHRDRLRLHLADTGEDDWGAWDAPLMQDVLGETDDMYAALAQAIEALEAQPPPADAAREALLLAEIADGHEALASAMARAEKAERERDAACGRAGAAVEAERAALDACDRYRRDRDAALARAEKAELELLCIRGWVEDDWAINCTERPTARAVVAMYAKLNSDARQAERALSEARAEIARLQAARDGERDAGRLEEREAVAVWLDAVMHRPRPEAMAAQVRAGRHLWLTAHLTPEDPDHA